MITSAPGREPLGVRALLFTALLVSAAAILFAGLFTAFGSENPDALGWDFRVAYYPAGAAVARGESPYPADPGDPALDTTSVYAYPPQLALLVAPLTALPVDVAVVISVLASLAAILGALALVGMRDIRCYAAVVIWAPGWNALQTANLSALLVLLLALVWRFRDMLWPLAAALGTMVSLKLFLWPLLVWVAATRRSRAAALAVLVGLAVTALSWAVIGFDGLRTYPEILDRVAAQESYSIKGMASELGLGSSAAYIAALAVTALLLVVTIRLAREGDQARAFFVAVLAALAVSPIVWLHYVVLLAVPLALVRPRFSALWLLPIVLWVSPQSENGEGVDPFVVALVVTLLALCALTRPRRPLVGSEVAS